MVIQFGRTCNLLVDFSRISDRMPWIGEVDWLVGRPMARRSPCSRHTAFVALLEGSLGQGWPEPIVYIGVAVTRASAFRGDPDDHVGRPMIV